jgi:hypothetical protein
VPTPGEAVPPIVYQALALPGMPLSASVRSDAEALLGVDLADVRIHLGPTAEASAVTVGARAYTVGRDVVFAAGEFSADSAADARLLTHELTHVAQQQGAAPYGPLEIGAPDSDQEREADRIAAEQPMRSSTLPPQPTAAQRALRRAVTTDIQPQAPDPAAADNLAQETPGHDLSQPTPDVGAVPESGRFSPGTSGGSPPASIPDYSFVMGGRELDFPYSLADYRHTYLNVKENATNFWCVEAGPLPTDDKHVGAWAKSGSWETRGNRVTSTAAPADFAATKALLFTNQALYHSMVLPYDWKNGPNSNSFTEHMSFKNPSLPSSFTADDLQWDYWKHNPRPF